MQEGIRKPDLYYILLYGMMRENGRKYICKSDEKILKNRLNAEKKV